MKKYLLTFLLIIPVFTMAFDPRPKHVKTGTPRTEIPAEFAGKWQMGTFSMTTFWNYDGSLKGNAGSYSLSYHIRKDGSAEEYFYSLVNSYGFSMEILGYRKGTVTWDEATNTITFYAASGHYRKVTNGHSEQKTYTANDLYPNYTPSYKNCTAVLRDGAAFKLYCTNGKSGNSMEFKKAEW